MSKISELTAASALEAGDELALRRGSGNRRADVSLFATAAQGALADSALQDYETAAEISARYLAEAPEDRIPFAALVGAASAGQADDLFTTTGALTTSVNTILAGYIRVVNGGGGSDLTIARPDTSSAVYWWNFGGKRPLNALPQDIIAGGPPTVESDSASVTVLPEWDGATLILTNATPALTIPLDATTPFSTGFQMGISSDNAYTIEAVEGVTIKGVDAASYDCDADPGAVVITRQGEDAFRLQGSAEVSA